MALIGIYGASGLGREVMPLARQTAAPGDRLVFIDDGQTGLVNGAACLSYEAFRQESEADKRVAIAIADAAVREKLSRKILDDGLVLSDIVSPTASIGDDCVVGPGTILCTFTILTSNIRIGTGFHANLYSYVAHDCVIGDYVTFAPGVMCNGNVHIEDYAYIGTGAVLKQGAPGKPTVIGRGAVIGMGAVVTKDVAPGTTVIGNPARLLAR